MSLHNLANHLQSAGRGEDKVLIHMTPKEVGGLQSLAMAHGGSLTINPQTGLPEAGFLSKLLPTLLGVGLSAMGIPPMFAAGIVGGGTTLATGSLQKGLMAGLGAYGGAGLGTSLSGLGAGAASSVTPVATGAAGATAPTLGGSVMAGAPGTFSAGAANTLGSGFMNTAPSSLANPFANITSATPQLTAAGQALQIPPPVSFSNMQSGLGQLNSMDALKNFGSNNVMNLAAAGAPMLMPDKFNPPKEDKGMIRPYTFDRKQNQEAYAPGTNAQGLTNTPVYGQPFDSSERSYFTDKYTAGTPYAAPGPEYGKASGGLTALAVGGPVEQMSAENSLSGNTMYPQSQMQTPMYSNAQMQRPMSSPVISAGGDMAVDPYTGEQKFADGGYTREAPMNSRMAATDAAHAKMRTAQGRMEMEKAARDGDYSAQVALQKAGYDMNTLNEYAAGGGISSLGGYSDGGHLLRGPGDGVSDSIPAQIGDKQPARLADGEFVVPARIVSELGNGSTEAGARQLYKMMERVQSNRKKSVGKGRVAVDAKSSKYLPA